MNELRQHLLWLLQGGNAHIGFDQAIADLAEDLRGRKPAGNPHTPWRILEHMRIVQWDILEFSRDPNHESPTFPQGYWPEQDAPSDVAAWDASVDAYLADAGVFQELIEDSQQDLFAPFPWGDGQTLCREALLVADHNAYHLGQLIEVRRGLGAWPR